MFTSIILFLIVLAILIVSHEFGHFIIAKWSGMRVDEFGLGFPPKIFSWTRGETTYSLNAVPFGGFVRIFGENPDEAVDPNTDYSRSFTARPKRYQAMVLVAGIVFNLILAWLLFSASFLTGLPISTSFFGNDTQFTNAKLLLTDVLPNSPAANAGLLAGSQIITVGEVSNPSVTQFQNIVAQNGGHELVISYLLKPNFSNQDLSSEIKTAAVIPAAGVVPGKAAIGVSLDMVALVKEPFYQAPITGAIFTAKMTGYTAQALYGFVKQLVVGERKEALAQVTGPVGLVGLVGQAGRLGLVYLLTFTALISINLAVINLIPFPALDGGRLLFLLIEVIKGSPIKPRVANAFNAVGFLLLIGLMILVTFKDVFVILGH